LAAVTNVVRRDSVFGDKRVVLATVDAAGTGDTYDTQLKLIQGLAVVPPSSTAVVASFSGGVVTLAYAGGGAMNGITLMAVGI